MVYKLLFIDDEPNLRLLGRLVFRRAFQVEDVGDLSIAQSRILSFHPDLVLTDLEYPGETSKSGGMDLLRGVNELRNVQEYQHLETALMSGHSSHEQCVQEALVLTTSKIFLGKPYPIQESIDRLVRYLEKIRTR